MYERDLELILSSLGVRPKTEAKQAAYKRMTARYAELCVLGSTHFCATPSGTFYGDANAAEETTQYSTGIIRELSGEELVMAAGGTIEEKKVDKNSLEDEKWKK